MPSKALFQPYFPFFHLQNIFRQLWCLCFLFSLKKQLGSCLSTQQKACHSNPLNTWTGCHPLWLRLSKRSWVSWSPMILPVSNGVLGCGEYAPLLVEWETFVYFTNTTKKATKGEHLWCLWLHDAYDQRWLGWFSGQQTQDERFRIILPTTQPKCANEINRNPLETHRIQLFWLNYHIHGKLQAVYWKISPLSPAIFCSSVLFMFPAFSPPGKGPVFFGKD